MKQRVKLNDLPPIMAQRAMTARMLACENPESLDIDDEMLPWIFDERDGVWLSFDGNYSAKSPAEKRAQAEAYRARQEEWEIKKEENARKQFELQMVWSMTRQAVLKRDQYSCTICGNIKETALHIHHILKKREGGTDHMDNLITVCNSCHKTADTKLYNPDWSKRPETEGQNYGR